MRRYPRVALALGSVLLSSLAFGQARLGPHVVDSNGQRIGYFIGSGAGGDEAVISIDGVSSRILITRDGFVTNDVATWNSADDCSGQDYVGAQPGRLLQTAWFTTDGSIHYLGSAQGPVSINGTRVMHANGTFGPCSTAGGGGPDTPAPILSTPANLLPPFLVVDAFPVSPAPGSATFNDVPTNHAFFQFIEALSASGITGGCQAAPPLYCPDTPVTRGQMAVFLAKALGL